MNCLIVEDDPTLQSFLVSCLQDMGHRTVAERTVEDALWRLKTQKFDLLLVDFSLPDGTSVPIMDYFGATCPNSRAILLTGSGVYPNGEASIFAPSVDWTLRKPIELQDLQAIVDYAELDTSRRPATAARY